MGGGEARAGLDDSGIFVGEDPTFADLDMPEVEPMDIDMGGAGPGDEVDLPGGTQGSPLRKAPAVEPPEMDEADQEEYLQEKKEEYEEMMEQARMNVRALQGENGKILDPTSAVKAKVFGVIEKIPMI